MTNIFVSKSIDNDYESFPLALSKTNKFKHKVEKSSYLRQYHRLTYIIALTNFKLKEKWNIHHKIAFSEEIQSDLLTNISITYLGFELTSQILMRRIIENFYNQIYYFDHPIEFELLNLGKNEYVPILELKKYLELHPKFRDSADANIKIFNDNIFKFYQELSRVVHSKGIDFLGLAKNINEIKNDFALSSFLSTFNNIILNIVYLLFKFHSELEFTNVEKDLVSKSFNRNYRRKLFE